MHACCCRAAAATHVATQVAGYNSASNIPWMVKPLIGFLSDGVPFFGYKRRSYLVAASVVGALAGE